MAGPFADVDPEHLLFVYGTLLPGEERWELLEPFVVGAGSPDSVAGTLYDTGEGYPAASFAAGDRRVAGQVFQLDGGRLDQALELLDEVEDAALGLYRRVRVVTDAGLDVWTYQYGTGLRLTPIDGGDWLSHPR
jgi:gamma-glutamylcyclotransferase (GGCT)/AIG2-like uncharacterized protein YtfP